MTDGMALKEEIKNSGISVSFIAKKMGKSRNRVYAITNGADCTASEITSLTDILHLDRDRRDSIFLRESVN